jgi:1-acyl-sn-glycerol-3-phosphate acyltransferase
VTYTDPIGLYSPRLLKLFVRYLRRFAARHFNGIRIDLGGLPTSLDRPTVIYSNHASWWDPAVMLIVASTIYSAHRFFAPMDTAALSRYRILRRFGLFALERNSVGGTRRFLSTCTDVLKTPNAALALTAEGRFTDVRARPVELMPGLSALLMRVPAAQAIPVAIEYPFWNEKRPEVLLRFGRDPVAALGSARDEVHQRLRSALETELDALAISAIERNPNAFESILTGQSAVGTFDSIAGRWRAWRNGRRFDPRHAAISEPVE